MSVRSRRKENVQRSMCASASEEVRLLSLKIFSGLSLRLLIETSETTLLKLLRLLIETSETSH